MSIQLLAIILEGHCIFTNKYLFYLSLFRLLSSRLLLLLLCFLSPLLSLCRLSLSFLLPDFLSSLLFCLSLDRSLLLFSFFLDPEICPFLIFVHRSDPCGPFLRPCLPESLLSTPPFILVFPVLLSSLFFSVFFFHRFSSDPPSSRSWNGL